MNKISKKTLAFVLAIALFTSVGVTSLAMEVEDDMDEISEYQDDVDFDDFEDVAVNLINAPAPFEKPGPIKPPHRHAAGSPVEENRVEATCTEEGSYDSVVYCQMCGDEMSRTPMTIDKIDHTPGEAVKENEVEATCTEDGSYDLVVYCTECEEELSRTTEIIDALGHSIVKDEAVEPTDTEPGLTEGSHCSLCGEIIVKQEEIPAKGQKDSPTKPEKNDVSPVIVVPVVNNDIEKTPKDTGTVIVDDTPLTGVEDYTPWMITSAVSFMVVLLFAFVIPRQKISYMY